MASVTTLVERRYSAVSVTHDMNAPAAMDPTDGREIVDRAAHDANALVNSADTPGIFTSAKAVQPRNVLEGILSREGKSAKARFVQLLKTDVPINVDSDGKATLLSEVHPPNAPLLILRARGMLTFERLLQFKNAFAPTTVQTGRSAY